MYRILFFGHLEYIWQSWLIAIWNKISSNLICCSRVWLAQNIKTVSETPCPSLLTCRLALSFSSSGRIIIQRLNSSSKIFKQQIFEKTLSKNFLTQNWWICDRPFEFVQFSLFHNKHQKREKRDQFETSICSRYSRFVQCSLDWHLCMARNT